MKVFSSHFRLLFFFFAFLWSAARQCPLHGVTLRCRRRFSGDGRLRVPLLLLLSAEQRVLLVQRAPGVPPVQQRLATQPGHLRPGHGHLSAQTRRERRGIRRRPGRVPRRRRRVVAVLCRGPSVTRVLLDLQLIVH